MSQLRRLRVSDGGQTRDLEVCLPRMATVEVLAKTIGVAGRSLSIDGRALAGWHSLDDAGVFDGVILEVDRSSVVEKKYAPVVVVDQLAGLPGGDSRLLESGRLDFSPSPDSEESFSLEISETGDVTVVPGTAPVVIDNVLIAAPTPLKGRILNVGSARFAVGRLPQIDTSISPSDMAADSSATRQRARTAPGPISQPVTPPLLPSIEPARFTALWAFLVSAVLVLVVLGIVVTPNFFALLAAVLAVAAAVLLGNRVRMNHEIRSHQEQTKRLVRRFETDVVSARHSVEGHLRRANPPIAELARAARGEVARYRNRSRGDVDFAQVVVGYGELDWQLEVESEVELAPALRRVLDDNAMLVSVPIVADLAAGTVGIVGDRDMALPCARAIAVTLATQSPGSDVRFSLVADEGQLGDWDWLKWLPQLDRTHPIALSRDEVARMFSASRTRGNDWLRVVIVDQPKWAADERGLLAEMANESDKRALIIICDDIADLPDCETIVVIGEDGMSTVTVSGATQRFVSPVAAGEGPTDTIARGAARLHRDLDENPVQTATPTVRPFDIESRRIDLAKIQFPPPIPTETPDDPDTVSRAGPPEVIDLREVGDQPRKGGKLGGPVGILKQLRSRRTSQKGR